ncbi:MAG: rRNA maturation RNase YbeY [Candidatus Aminicenantes bacterium]|jgi:probable rRNA maturation factor|nr:rRNA maturation RNase YbeY [Candidatus Aminicenantes bacterium]
MIQIINFFQDSARKTEPPKIDNAFYLSKLEKITKELGVNGDFVIKLGGKEEARELNNKYLKRDYPTDVLSFPFNEELPGGFYLGDIFICLPIAEEQAEENKITVQEEMLRLMIHGILHLTGRDHETDKGEMNRLQERLVKLYLHRDP